MKLDKTKRHWWQSAVFYQIYPKSFQDTDGDGIGDIPGIISRLDYLQSLGIDGIWLSPVCQSPQVDNGYDISDYQAIYPVFGTMEDMETLIREAGKRDITIIMDLVLNHCSNQHPWFLEALKGKDNPYHDYFIWRDGDGITPPNDMCAVFGGSMWEYVPELQQYYFHQFAAAQPDLNWENPALRQELYNMIRFWVDKGIGGFRLDVIDQIAKVPEEKITANGPRLHEFLREMSAAAFREDGIVTVGEAWGADVERAKIFSSRDGKELSMVFQFQHMGLDQQPDGEKWDMKPLYIPDLKKCVAAWQEGLENEGWNSLFMNNHDLPRIVSRWGNDKEYREESAKMLATYLHGLQGTPYIYQGEEIGMTNIRLPLEDYVDLEIHNVYAERTAKGYDPADVLESIYGRGRDNARTPMQWTAGENAGFTTGKPWLPVNENHSSINVEAALADPDSIFHYYQKLIALRKTYEVFRSGRFTLLLPDDKQRFVYRRDTVNEHLLVICNFGETFAPLADIEIPENAKLLLTNYAQQGENLKPYEARLYFWA